MKEKTYTQALILLLYILAKSAHFPGALSAGAALGLNYSIAMI